MSGPRPFVASVNHGTGQIVSNAVIVPVSPTGDVCFYSSASTDLIVDIGGQSVVAKVDGHAPVKVGDNVELLADLERLHAFDVDSELAIGR